MTTFHNLALPSKTSVCRLVGIVCSRTQAKEFVLFNNAFIDSEHKVQIDRPSAEWYNMRTVEVI
jgi:hypothetical protein